MLLILRMWVSLLPYGEIKKNDNYKKNHIKSSTFQTEENLSVRGWKEKRERRVHVLMRHALEKKTFCGSCVYDMRAQCRLHKYGIIWAHRQRHACWRSFYK